MSETVLIPTIPITQSSPTPRKISERRSLGLLLYPILTGLHRSNYRSWFWTQCREFGWWISGTSQGPTLVSTLIQPSYYARQCQLMFKGAFSGPPVPNALGTNQKYNGWNVKGDRLFFANGRQDPWREVTTSAETQDFVGTALQPIELSNGFHSSDLRVAARIDPTIAAVQDKALASFKAWLAVWVPGPSHIHISPSAVPAPTKPAHPSSPT